MIVQTGNWHALFLCLLLLLTQVHGKIVGALSSLIGPLTMRAY